MGEILKVYMDESVEEDVQVEEKEEIISEEPVEEPEVEEQLEAKESNIETPVISNNSTTATAALTFSDVDKAIDTNKQESEIIAPKDIDILEKISAENHQRRKEEEAEEEAED